METPERGQAAAAPVTSGALVPVQPSPSAPDRSVEAQSAAQAQPAAEAQFTVAAQFAVAEQSAAAAQSKTVAIALPGGASPTAAASSAAALAQVLPVRQAPLGRGPVIFALISLLVALVAGGAYVVHRMTAPPELTPEETINGFLSAVFLVGDPARVGDFICSSWDGQDAVDRTTKEIEPGAHVSWDQLRIVSTTDADASATARLGQRLADDTRPSIFKQWRFELKKESRWRVCEARPVGA